MYEHAYLIHYCAMTHNYEVEEFPRFTRKKRKEGF